MTIAAIWLEGGVLWCAADTRLSVETVSADKSPGQKDSKVTSNLTAKIYSIPLLISACDPSVRIDAADAERRHPHFWTQYGFVYSGSALAASQTAINASTMLQGLVRLGERTDPPRFEEVAEFMGRIASHFMRDRCNSDADGLFDAAFFGWCPHVEMYKTAFINGRNDCGSFRVELTFPTQPENETDPWVVLGSGRDKFLEILERYKKDQPVTTSQIPRRVIDLMVSDGEEETVGGATSIGVAHRNGFQLLCAVESVCDGEGSARRLFNGLDLDADVGRIGDYVVGVSGVS